MRAANAKQSPLLEAAVGTGRRLLFFVCIGATVLTSHSVLAGNYSSATAYINGQQVAALDVVIAAYETIEQAGGWPIVTTDNSLIPGGRSPLVRQLRQRLRATADYTSTIGADPLLFDRNLLEALQRFQIRHGLRPSGYVDRQTLYALNQSVTQKLAMLRDSRERWSALQPYSGERQVWVNIPEARVAAIDNGLLTLNMNAIVGQANRRTPELKSTIRRVVVNPTWTVPRSIATLDLLPKQQQDNSYFNRNNIRVYRITNGEESELDATSIDWSALSIDNFGYQLKQDPGPNNSLGRIKFDFANDHDVFLHDTPGKSLLDLSFRSLSSGCVRLSEAKPLAEWMLANYEKNALAQALSDDRFTTASLRVTPEVPIQIVYILAWISTDDGTVQFRNDIYRKLTRTE